ncbi:MAG: hypothetical protein KDC24_12415 [Saprospiraceae bacterium]|nr:hypothetical protein [Saprospiraceae bacterium]
MQAFNSGEWMLLAALLIISFLVGILLMWFIWSGKVKKLQSLIETRKRNYKSKELEFDRIQKRINDLEIELEKQQKVKLNSEKELVKLKAENQIKLNKLEGAKERIDQLKENINAQAVTIETLHNQLLDLKNQHLSPPISKSTRSKRTKPQTQKSETS